MIRFTSNSPRAVMERLRRLPKIVGQVMDAAAQRDAVAFIHTYQHGIEQNSLGLAPLSARTVARKRSLGQPKPRTPLYGEGRGEKNSLINVFRIVRVKNGWRVRPRSARHHKAAMKLVELLSIHEFGAYIRKPSGAVIIIPPRPAVANSWVKYLRARRAQEISRDVRTAIDQLMRTGRSAHAAGLKQKMGAVVGNAD